VVLVNVLCFEFGIFLHHISFSLPSCAINLAKKKNGMSAMLANHSRSLRYFDPLVAAML
jgi:hypothetical protein